MKNSELPQEYPICDFSRHLPDNPDTLYLNIIPIPPSPKRTIISKIDLSKYIENDDYDKKSGRFIMIGKLVPFLMSFQIRRSFINTEIDQGENPSLLLKEL